MPVKVDHISTYFPETILTNTQLAEQFPQTTDEQIFKNTGIRQRYVSAPKQIASDMAVEAAEKLFNTYIA